MSSVIPYLLQHCYAVVFLCVFAEIIGVPISSIPVLLAAGALAGAHRVSFGTSLGLAMSACLLADGIWYRLGGWRGLSILQFLCRISLEPDSCVRKTQDNFTRRGGRTLLISKFVPGLGAVAAPLAGMLPIPPLRFLLWDAGGSLLWAGAYLTVGYLLSPPLDRLGVYALRMGGGLVVLLVAGLAVHLAWKFRERRRFVRNLRIARITPEELFQRLEAGDPVAILDLRGAFEYEADPVRLRGSLHMLPSEIEHRHAEIPRDRDVILYCT